MGEEENEDRISALPDSMIQHILFFLPSTKEAIQTGILSKRWKNQWTQVPVLILSPSGMSSQNYLQFIENALTLNSCSKINKFHLHYPSIDYDGDPQFDAKVLFATRKNVEELILASYNQEYMLPEFLFSNASLVKLRTVNCSFLANGKVNWGCLTSLIMEGCSLEDQVMQHILSGSPLLKSLELRKLLFWFDKLVIASNSLKRLVIGDDHVPYNSFIEIECPNLEELSLKDITTDNPDVLGPMVENVLSVSLFLESFEMIGCSILISMVIASKSLKRLVLGHLVSTCGIELSCPKLEKLKLFDCLSLITPKLHDLPTSLRATCDFYYHFQLEYRHYEYVEEHKGLIIEILQQLHHVKKLKLSIWFMEILSAIELEGLICPVLNIKCLTLNYPYLNRHHAGIACLLRSSPVLEKLVIKVPFYGQFHKSLHRCLEHPKTNDYGEKYWTSQNEAVFDCLVSHLKTIEIIGFPKITGFPKKDIKRKLKLVLNFIQFLLKNARVLEKMVVLLKEDESAFQLEVSRELLNLPRCSQNATIEVLCCK